MKNSFIGFLILIAAGIFCISCDVLELQKEVEMDDVATPTFSVAAGEYPFKQTIAISCKTSDVIIYYTLDGSNPSDKSTRYQYPVTITETTTIKALAVKEKMKDSQAASISYTITNPLTSVNYKDFSYVGEGTYTQKDLSTDSSFEHTISAFYVGQYEVTYQLWYIILQWAKSYGYTFAHDGTEGSVKTTSDPPADTSNDERQPVVNISWRDAIVWCNAYSDAMNRTPCYTYGGGVIRNSNSETVCDNAVCDLTANGYRLPTEGEWQYAAGYNPDVTTDPTPANYASGAAGDTTADVSTVAWWAINSGNHTWSVKLKQQNKLPACDMSGNVAELCWDVYGDYPTTAVINYTGIMDVSSSRERAIRGGSFKDLNKSDLAIGKRSKVIPYYIDPHIGFRLVTSIVTTE